MKLSIKEGGKEWLRFIKAINSGYTLLQQATMINKTIGSCRYVFNWALGRQKKKDVYWYITEEMVQNGQLNKNNWKSEFFSSTKEQKVLTILKKN